MKGRGKRQNYVTHHEDWPLRRFVLRGSCGKPLTFGWSTKSRGKPNGFYFCAQKGCRAVNARNESIERDWVNLLAMKQPTVEGVNQVAETAATGWSTARSGPKKKDAN